MTEYLARKFKFLGLICPSLAAKIAWLLFCTPLGGKKSFTKNEIRMLNQAKKSHITLNSYKIIVYKWTPSELSTDGLVILLTHGWSGRSLDFTNIITELIREGHIVIVYDSPAHGSSSGKQANIQLIANSLIEVAKISDQIDVLISHSFGGLTNSLALNLCHDNKVLSQVKKCIIISSPGSMVNVVQAFVHSMNLPYSVFKLFCKKVEYLVKRPIELVNIPNLLKDYSGQILIIHDKNDTVIEFTEAEYNVSHLNAELFTTDGLGHGRILSSPAVATAISDFINN